MDEDERKLTEQEIALLRAIVRWRRGVGASFFLHRRGRGFAGAYGFAEWNRFAGAKRQGVAFERETPNVLTYTKNYHGVPGFDRVGVDSIEQAAGILAAVGILPARFSPAYRAGWDARRED